MPSQMMWITIQANAVIWPQSPSQWRQLYRYKHRKMVITRANVMKYVFNAKYKLINFYLIFLFHWRKGSKCLRQKWWQLHDWKWWRRSLIIILLAMRTRLTDRCGLCLNWWVGRKCYGNWDNSQLIEGDNEMQDTNRCQEMNETNARKV